MSDRVSVPVIVGLVVGIAFVVSFSMFATTFPEESSASDSQEVIIPEGSSSLENSKRTNFEPETITVVVGVNNTITWVNEDNAAVGIRADDKSDPDFYDAAEDSLLMPNETFVFTFTKPGIFDYHSEPGPWRHGTVEVRISVEIPTKDLPALSDSEKEEFIEIARNVQGIKEWSEDGWKYLGIDFAGITEPEMKWTSVIVNLQFPAPREAPIECEYGWVAWVVMDIETKQVIDTYYPTMSNHQCEVSSGGRVLAGDYSP